MNSGTYTDKSCYFIQQGWKGREKEGKEGDPEWEEKG